MWLSFFNDKSAKNINKSIYIEATDIENICIRDTYTRSIYIGNDFSIINICIKDISFEGIDREDINIENISISNASDISAIKSLGIYL